MQFFNGANGRYGVFGGGGGGSAGGGTSNYTSPPPPTGDQNYASGFSGGNYQFNPNDLIGNGQSNDPWNDYFRKIGVNGQNGTTSQYTPPHMALLASGGLYPTLLQQLGFSASQEPQRQAAYQNAQRSMNPANNQSYVDKVRRSLASQALMASKQSSSAMAGQGISDAAQAGNTQAYFNQANQQGNDIQNEYMSPEHQAQQYAQLAQLIQGGQMPTLWNQLMQGLGTAAGAQPAPSPPDNTFGDVLGFLASGAGALAGGGLGGGAAGKLGKGLGNFFGSVHF